MSLSPGRYRSPTGRVVTVKAVVTTYGVTVVRVEDEKSIEVVLPASFLDGWERVEDEDGEWQSQKAWAKAHGLVWRDAFEAPDTDGERARRS